MVLTSLNTKFTSLAYISAYLLHTTYSYTFELNVWNNRKRCRKSYRLKVGAINYCHPQSAFMLAINAQLSHCLWCSDKDRLSLKRLRQHVDCVCVCLCIFVVITHTCYIIALSFSSMIAFFYYAPIWRRWVNNCSQECRSFRRARIFNLQVQNWMTT